MAADRLSCGGRDSTDLPPFGEPVLRERPEAVRILHVSGWLAPRYGGSTAFVLGSASSVAALGYQVDVVSTNIDGDDTLEVPVRRAVSWNGIDATFHPLDHPRRYLTSWSMLRDLRKRMADYDVVHIHSLYRFHTVAAAVTARRAGVPYIVQAHGSLDPWHRGQHRRAKDVYHALVEDSVIRGAAAILCTSGQEEDAIRDLGYQVPTWVVPIGTDVAAMRTPASADDLPILKGVGSDARIIGFLGRISEKKGVDILVEAFRRVSRTFPTAYLVVAGPDDEGIVRDLRPGIAAHGLSERILFIGTIGGVQKRALLQRADVMVLPSADESFGIVVLEGMAVGCPVVVSTGVALHEVVRSAGAGLVVDRDADAVAGAIGVILDDQTLAQAMGDAGKEVVDQRFSWPTVARELVRLYEAIARTSPVPLPSAQSVINVSAREIDDSPVMAARNDEMPLACPVCRGPLRRAQASLKCGDCPRAYPVIDGIPILVPDVGAIEHDELDHQHEASGRDTDRAHKVAQADHFDRSVAEEFEIERPHGTPRLYRFLLDEKFRRAVRPIGAHLAGSTALTVCGGSGMDAEYLARRGARVVSTDLSLGAARRSHERARRYGLDITAIVADVEHLPFAARAFDIVLVHDGLHHLERPRIGLDEMARVSRRWVSVTEPSKAFATAIAVKVGIASDQEEAGNRVERMSPDEVAGQLATHGMRPLLRERYAMYYPHDPGRSFRALSLPAVFPVVRMGWRIGNALIGRAGNKMVVVAARDDDR